MTLTNLMVAVALVATIAAVAGATLSTSATDAVRDGTIEVVNLWRRARAVAARYNQAVVVVVRPYGSVVSDDGTKTRGRVEAHLSGTFSCPSERPTDTPFELVDFGTFTGDDSDTSPGIALVENDLDVDDACIRPNGRIISRAQNAPFQPDGGSGLDLAGKAYIWVQYDPIRMHGGELALPRQVIEVPFNGLVRVPQ